MSSKRMRVGLAIVALAAIGVVAASAAAGTTKAAKSSKLTTVRVGLALIPPKMTFIGFYVARDKGFFKKNGLDVKLMGEGDGVKSLRGTAAGAFDMAGTSADDVIAAAAQGGGITSVWGYAMPLDTAIVADKSIKTLADLKGKKIGITDPGGFADTQVRAVLAMAHIPASQAQIISFSSRSAFVPSIVAGQINAAPFHVDDGFTAQAQDPNLHVVAAVYKSLPNWWYGSLAVTDSYKKDHAATIAKFVNSMIEADRWIYSHQAQTIAIGVKETAGDEGRGHGGLQVPEEGRRVDGQRRAREEAASCSPCGMSTSSGRSRRCRPTTRSSIRSITNGVLGALGHWKKGY